MKTAKEIIEKITTYFAEVEAAGEEILLSEGVATEVECARPGKFTDMNGTVVEFTPESLTSLAGTLDPEDSLVKIGHVEIQTDTPDYGRVVGLRYDAGKSRLLASIVPTPALVRKNREEGFKRVSMELAERLHTSMRAFGFKHLAFLAARPPAIKGLAPVTLAAAIGEKTFVFAEAPDVEVEFEVEKKTLDTSGTVELPKETTQEKPKMDATHEAQLAAANETATKAKAENERLRSQLAESVRPRVKAFLSENVKRVPMALLKAGVEEALVAMLADEVQSAAPTVLKFSIADGKDKTKAIEETPAASVLRLLAALPELTTRTEATEDPREGTDGERIALAEFPDAVPDSAEMHFAIEKQIADAKAKGQTMTYFEAAKAVESGTRRRVN